MNDSPHQPVLYKEIIHALQPRTGGRYVDGTLGAGGHARGILEVSAPDGQLLGLDVDPQALAIARKTLAPYEHRIHLAQASYTTLAAQLKDLEWDLVDGIVLDLGASSMHFDTPERGFSFMQDAPLDMRFGPHALQTAADIVNSYSERELADLIMLEGGAGLDRPYPEQAAIWYHKLASAQADAGAAHTLGILYAQGTGVPKDARRAKDLFELAIAMSADKAMASLGLLLLRGDDGIERDLVEAAKWALLSIQHERMGMGEQLLAMLSPHLGRSKVRGEGARSRLETDDEDA